MQAIRRHQIARLRALVSIIEQRGSFQDLRASSDWTSNEHIALCTHSLGYNAAALGQFRQYAKDSKQKAKKVSPPAADAQSGTGLDVQPFESLMTKAIHHLQHELANIRTGRATPGMLDHLKIDAYGDKVPLKAVGTVSVRDSHLLIVTLFDPGLVTMVVSAIAKSPLQLNPRVEGQEILVPVPPPTAETVEAMRKLCKAEGETAKVSIRHARKLALDAARALPSDDAKFRIEKQVQNLTDNFIAETDQLVAAKQKDIVKHNA